MILKLLLLLLGGVVGSGLTWLALQDRQPPPPKLLPRKRSMSGVSGNDVLLAMMSHQLRTPLNSIIGYAELLQEDAVFLEQNDFVPDLVRIKRSGQHVLALLDDVIDLAHIASERAHPDLGHVDVAALLASIEEDLQPLMRRTLARLTVEVADGVGTVTTDGGRLERALSNLVRQVIALTAQGEMKLVASKEGEYLVFRLTQDALVLEKAQIEALLLDMADGPEGAVEGAHGAGLGLVTTKEFAKLLGGNMVIEPKPGEGVDFVVLVRVG